MSEALRHPLLEVEHGFGVRDMPRPADAVQPKQVHGIAVARVERGVSVPAEADAILATAPGTCVAVITADCVPILVSDERGAAVAAIHAGWRGLAAGVIERGIAALRAQTNSSLVAVIGPHIGPCCYEVDAPVIDGLRARFGSQTQSALQVLPEKPGHAMLDLGALAALDLERSGLPADRIARLEIDGVAVCTQCDPGRFHSYRRDGERAGRILHYIRARGA